MLSRRTTELEQCKGSGHNKPTKTRAHAINGFRETFLEKICMRARTHSYTPCAKNFCELKHAPFNVIITKTSGSIMFNNLWATVIIIQTYLARCRFSWCTGGFANDSMLGRDHWLLHLHSWLAYVCDKKYNINYQKYT